MNAHPARLAFGVIARVGHALDELLAEFIHEPSLLTGVPARTVRFASSDRSSRRDFVVSGFSRYMSPSFPLVTRSSAAVGFLAVTVFEKFGQIF